MNAIIMAAGLGSRFKEMTHYKHKALLPIENRPNLERTIEFLQEKKVNDIHILTGYLHETFTYLVEKYPCITLHYNPYYKEYNNSYTFSLALPFFGDSFVIDGDTVFKENIFNKPEKSTYFTMIREEKEIEWCPITDQTGRVVSMKITDEPLPAMTGVTYWSKKDAKKIKEAFSPYLQKEKVMDSALYWDDIPVSLFPHLDVTVKELKRHSLYEMDTQENYFMILKQFKK